MATLEKPVLTACLDEVIDRITTLAGRSTALVVDESGLGRLRTVRTPVQRRAAKQGYSFSDAGSLDLIRIWDYVWRSSDLMEIKHQALYSYQHKTLKKLEFDRIRLWIDDCLCWEHSDDLSKIYAGVAEQNPDWILGSLRKWNQAANPWKRRQSVVALIEYADRRTRFLPFEFMISQVEALLDDEDYYVQKGVGWAIREIGHAYPAETWQFMERHAAHLSPAAWTGATKKLDPEKKLVLKTIRSA